MERRYEVKFPGEYGRPPCVVKVQAQDEQAAEMSARAQLAAQVNDSWVQNDDLPVDLL